MSLINSSVKPFKATAFHNGKFVDVSDASFKGKWSVVMFYPADFSVSARMYVAARWWFSFSAAFTIARPVWWHQRLATVGARQLEDFVVIEGFLKIFAGRKKVEQFVGRLVRRCNLRSQVVVSQVVGKVMFARTPAFNLYKV